jgi:ACR3 family arsenite transporter
MSAQCESAANASMSVFERYLTVWVFLCIIVGIVLGQMIPAPFQMLGKRWYERGAG